MNLIDIIVDGLIHRFDSVLHEYLSVEQLCAMDTGQLLDFLDQGQRLLITALTSLTCASTGLTPKPSLRTSFLQRGWKRYD